MEEMPYEKDIKYAGIDLHQSTCLIVIDDKNVKAISESVVKTEAETLRSFFRGLEGPIHVAFEVGTQSAWLYEILKPVVTSITVCDVRKHKRRGSERDRIDARKLARWLRMGELEAVYQGDRNVGERSAFCFCNSRNRAPHRLRTERQSQDWTS